MAHSNGVITAPVGIYADIAPVLGVGSYDLGYLCSNAHGKINKWSYIKPKEANTPDCEHKTSQMYRRVTADKKIGTGYAMVTVNSWGMTAGDWEVYPFLSTAILKQDDPDIAHIAYSVPMVNKSDIEIVGSYVSISIIGGTMPSIMGYIEVTVRVRNSSSSPVSFRNNSCMARFASKKFEDPMVIGEARETIEDFQVSANSSIDKKVRIFISSDLIQSGSCRVWVSLNSAAYKGSTLLLSMGPGL